MAICHLVCYPEFEMAELTQKRTISRLNFRIPSEIKERVEEAALVSGTTVTDFAITALANSAEEAIHRHQTRTLSNRDRDIFLKMLENPAEPNEALKRAAKRYKERLGK